MARPSRAKRKMLREKHREVSATRPAPRRHFDANGRAAMIDAWRQIVGAPSAPELAEANKLQDDAIRTRIAARGYGAAGYDLLAAAPDLACALNARPLLVLEFPLLDVLASVQSSALDFPPDPDFSSVRVVIGNQERFTSSLVRWAWIGLIARTDKGPGVALVTASQRALPSPSPALHALFDSFAGAIHGGTYPRFTSRTDSRQLEEGRIPPGVRARVMAAVQRNGFKPHRLMVGANAAQFMIHDVVINHRSQFVADGQPIPGDVFRPGYYGAADTTLSFESLQAGQTATIVVEYVGPDPAGEAFDAVMIGSIEPHADTEISYHHAPLDAVMAAPEALREQLAQHCGVRLPAATPV